MTADKTEGLNQIRDLLSGQTSDDDVSRAIVLTETLSRLHPEDADIASQLAQLYLARDDTDKAVAPLLTASAANPSHVGVRLALIRCLVTAGRWRDAIPHALDTIKLESQDGRLRVTLRNIEAVSTLGTDALFKDDWSLAESYFKAVIGVLRLRFVRAAATPSASEFTSLPSITDRPIHKILYLPIEVKAREFEAKSLLAVAAAARGFHVVFGRSWVLTHGAYTDLPPGIVLFKTLNAMDANNMRICRAGAGHLIAALDEEAFGRSDSARALRLNVAPPAVTACDLILMQGDAQRDTLKQTYDLGAAEIITTGNPKSDILMSNQPTAQPPAGADSPMILFCTMSGNVNPRGRSFARTMEQTLVAGATNSTADMIDELCSLLDDSTSYEIAVIPQLREAIRVSAQRFPNANIVVRPHPIENAELWQDQFADLDNVRVETHGPLTHWLNQCRVMVYVAGCATGLEAALRSVPAIRFIGDGRTKDPDVGLSSRLNTPAQTAAEVGDAIETLLSDGVSAGTTADLGSFLKLGTETNVGAAVADQLETFFRNKATDRGDVPVDELINLRLRRRDRFQLKELHLQKFPDTSTEEVNASLKDLATRFGFDAPADAIEIEDGLFLLPPQN